MMLDGIRGHRTFLLVSLISLPLMVRTMMLTDTEFTSALVQWAAILAGIGGALWGSKRGEADKIRSQGGH